MPYNTRRISLSLTSLGVQVPRSASQSHRSPPGATPNGEPAAKKQKRAHSSSISATPSPSLATKAASSKSRDERPKSAGRVAENTPPPSPGGEQGNGSFKIDTEGINDEIVVGVIEQLEKTGNRPHLLKELAAILANTLPLVESSANPSAIISSRLSTYLRRPWTALAPCPVGKELVGTHPKRTYFFLTTSQRQPYPESTDISAPAKRILSPSISSAAEEEDQSRVRESLSPEIDLSTPELDDDTEPTMPTITHGRTFSVQTHAPPNGDMSHNRRAQSPPLERDEKEFTQTASSLQQRSRSQTMETQAMADPPQITTDDDMTLHDIEETEETFARRNSEAAAVLFGHTLDQSHLSAHSNALGLSSFPMIKPQLEINLGAAKKLGDALMMDDEDSKIFGEDGEFGGWRWTDLKSPENVDMKELDEMFGGY